MKKLIGITCGYSKEDKRPALNFEYLDAVSKNGGLPVALPPVGSASEINEIVERMGGFILSGGGDIDPSLLGVKAVRGLKGIDKERDIFELELTKTAYKKNKPVLGICKGAQIINTAFGGSLWLDIPTKIRHLSGSHPISISSGTKLRDLTGKDKLIVNSSHHQAVKETGKGLRVSAFSVDGVIESIETADDSFVLGVQFHPERMFTKTPAFRRMFRKFIERC